MPGGALAQGSIFSIFGTGLGPPSPGVQASEFPLRVTLAGVSIRLLHQSGVALAAIPLFFSDAQINAVLPSTTPIGQVFVSVSYNGRTSAAQPIKVVRSSFGIFTRDSSGVGTAIAQNFVSSTEQPLNSPSVTAKPGQTMILWGTGLGPIAGLDNAAPSPVDLSEPVEVTLGGRPAPIDYRGRSGCCAGVDQINFRVPADAPAGCAVPIQVKLQDGVFSNVASIAIDPEGRPCSDSWNLRGAQRFAQVSLTRTASDGGPADAATALFGEADPPSLWPPLSSCSAAGAGRWVDAIDAGPPLALTGPQGPRTLAQRAIGSYNSAAGDAFLGPGTYTVTGAGGRDVGPFTASLAVGAPFAWNSTTGTRARGITFSWSGGDPQSGFVMISGLGWLCTAPVAPGSLTVPPGVLADSPAQARVTVEGVWRTAFTAPGLDQGALSYRYVIPRVINLGEPPLASSPVLLPNGRRILAEVASNTPEQERGLMQRTELAPDRGMLFVFDRPQTSLKFWMFQTLIPLDIIWLNQGQRIIFISANTPPCRENNPDRCPLYGPNEAAAYVLEIAAGRAAELGLRVGDTLNW